MSSCSEQDTVSCENNRCFCSLLGTWRENKQMDILEDSKYILSSNFDTGDIFTLESGLSPGRNFSPAIRIVNKTDHSKISFSYSEWNAFIKHLKHISENYFEQEQAEETNINLESDELIKIQTSNFLSAKMVKVISSAILPSTSLYFSEMTVKSLIRLANIILKHRMETLEKIKFSIFYYNFVETVKKLIFKANYEISPEQLITSFCEILSDSIDGYCMRETWFYYKQKVLDDLDQP